jgi:hypothetical protein
VGGGKYHAITIMNIIITWHVKFLGSIKEWYKTK